MPDRTCDVISADSHVVEPPDLFRSRVASKLVGRMPVMGELDGAAAWFVEGVEPTPLAAP